MGQKQSTPAICPELDTHGPDIQPLTGTLTFHRFSVIVSGAAALFAAIIALFLIMMHATHFSDPRKQKQIIRIACILPSFAVISFLVCCYNGNAASYILPGLDLSEALPMASFFLLLTDYVVPDGDFEGFFAHYELQDKRGNVQPGGSSFWYQKLAFGVTQWLVVSILLWIATAASLAAGTYCATSNNIHFAHIWITIIRLISVSTAVLSIFKFYRRTSSVVRPQGALKQLICVKILVFLNFVQTFIFSILKSSHALHPTSYLTINDLSNTIPSLLLSCEIALVAPFFLYAYRWAPYKIGYAAASDGSPKPQHYHGGFLGLRALLAAANLFDVFTALARGLKVTLGNSKSGGGYVSAGAPARYYVPNEYSGVDYRDGERGQEDQYVMTRGAGRGGARNY